MDACLFAVSFWVALELRSNPAIIEFLHLPPPISFDAFLWFYLVLIPASPLILEWQGFYNRPLVAPRRAAIWPLFKACLITTLSMILVLFFFRLTIGRSVMIWFGAVSFVLVLCKEEIMRWAYTSKLAQAQYRRRYVLVGAPEELRRMKKDLASHPDSSVQIVAELDLAEATAAKLIPLLHEHSTNGVIASARHIQFDRLEEIIKTCELEGVEAWVVADFFGTQISRASFDEFYGRPVMVFRSAPEASWQGVIKQVIDVVGAFLLLILLSPFFVLVALLIKLTSPGPVLFRQQRAGLNGSPFTMYKFRTMVTNAEQMKQELASLNEMSGPVFKIAKDPRVTAFGRWLRRTSVDEFPQLFNVLRSEMSLVGPRPLPVDEVERFDDLAHRRRLSVKPGLTCLWQIRGRNQISDFREWVRLDLEYIDNWSLWLDLKIIARTIPVVLFGKGAK